jgi:hypothetical protein
MICFITPVMLKNPNKKKLLFNPKTIVFWGAAVVGGDTNHSATESFRMNL